MNLRSFYNPIQRKKKRYEKIVQILGIKDSDRVLNLGSGKGYTFEIFNKKNDILGMDIFPKEENLIKQDNFKYLERENDVLPFKDNEFDVVVSIGVLEHVFPESSFKKTCEEIQRVGKRFAVVVPSYWTLIEPHYSFPFFQHFSLKNQRRLNDFFKLKYVEEKQEVCDFEEIRYLKKRDWKKLFPNSNIISYKHIPFFVSNYIIWKKDLD